MLLVVIWLKSQGALEFVRHERPETYCWQDSGPNSNEHDPREVAKQSLGDFRAAQC